MMIDQNKRKTLKTISVTGAGVTAAAAVPGAFAAAQRVLGKTTSVNHVPFSGVTVTHYENFQGHTVLLRNKADRAVTLLEVSPRYVSTPAGEFDLNVLFEHGEFTIPANTTRAVSITHEGKAKRHASWTHIDRGSAIVQTGNDTQTVSVIGQYDTLNRISASRVHTVTMYVS